MGEGGVKADEQGPEVDLAGQSPGSAPSSAGMMRRNSDGPTAPMTCPSCTAHSPTKEAAISGTAMPLRQSPARDTPASVGRPQPAGQHNQGLPNGSGDGLAECAPAGAGHGDASATHGDADASTPDQVCCSLTLTIHVIPNLSAHMPNTSPHICFSRGTDTVPPSDSLSQ